MPYFRALAPNYDLTFSPAVYTKQGLLLDAKWRHRLENGVYTLHMAGIDQLDPEAFVEEGTRNSGDVALRGGLRTTGTFFLNRLWTFGWDATLLSDRTFTRDYNGLYDPTDVAVSQVHLTGLSQTNYFDVRGYYSRVLTNDTGAEYDQGRQPFVAPGGRPELPFRPHHSRRPAHHEEQCGEPDARDCDCVDSGGDGLAAPATPSWAEG